MQNRRELVRKKVRMRRPFRAHSPQTILSMKKLDRASLKSTSTKVRCLQEHPSQSALTSTGSPSLSRSWLIAILAWQTCPPAREPSNKKSNGRQQILQPASTSIFGGKPKVRHLVNQTAQERAFSCQVREEGQSEECLRRAKEIATRMKCWTQFVWWSNLRQIRKWQPTSGTTKEAASKTISLFLTNLRLLANLTRLRACRLRCESLERL